ncbi:lig_chan-Glu_bd domain-containing protein [Trichonephila inaurata madagascariensis]|uniref:Lig_chan-Glu_bd domain-containing protein n=1 Tax=Trichonephila inaurata madagascariensis TaxID=2747483 RepID=A0A8X7CQG1_9ARAC|nr:lig_chan-Glu_bd domain-containing protein [Trichonephila inaurata madagascariensis]
MMNFSKWIVAALNISMVFEVYVNDNGKTRIAGIEGNFADAVFTEMNIEYDIVFPEDNEYGREVNGGNWTGLIGMVQRGEADIAMGTLGINEKRFRVVDYSFPYTADKLTFVVLKPSEWLMAFGFFNLLDLSTWMLLFGSFLLSTALFFTMLRGRTAYLEVVHIFFGSILRQPLIFHNYAYGKKFFIGTWLLFSFIMSSVFSGVLLSFLATPSKVETIKNFRELSKAVERGTHRVYTLKGTFAVPFFLNSKEPYFRLLGNAIEQNNWYIRMEELLHNPLKNKDVIVCPSQFLKLLYGNQPGIHFSEDSGYTMTTAFVLRKDFCCRTQLKKVMSRMVSAGIYDRFFKLETLKYSLSLPANEKEMDKKRILTLNHLFGAFSVLLSGLGISFLVFFGEVISNYMTRETSRSYS